MKRVTLKDVSIHTGVSMMTVSNVINGRDGFVGAKTRGKVQAAIKELNYRPNRSGRRLRHAASLSIGFVIMNDTNDFLTDPFISSIASGMCNYLSELGYCLEIQGVRQSNFQQANAFCNSANDAICVILCGPKEQRLEKIEFLKNLGQPIVILQEDYISDVKQIAVIRQNDYEAGKLIATHMLEKAPKRILFIKPQTDWSAIEQRKQGVKDVLKQTGSPIIISELVTASEMFNDVFAAVESTINNEKYDCIIAATDSIAMAVLKVCEKLNLAIPRDIRVAGFNGFESWKYSSPLLTTVVSAAYEMGIEAGKMMLGYLKAAKFENNNTVFPVHLKIGKST